MSDYTAKRLEEINRPAIPAAARAANDGGVNVGLAPQEMAFVTEANQQALENLSEAERDRLFNLETQLMETEGCLRMAERALRKVVKPEDWKAVELYAEEFAELARVKRAINNIVAHAARGGE